jgi:hypothetical protein
MSNTSFARFDAPEEQHWIFEDMQVASIIDLLSLPRGLAKQYSPTVKTSILLPAIQKCYVRSLVQERVNEPGHFLSSFCTSKAGACKENIVSAQSACR